MFAKLRLISLALLFVTACASPPQAVQPVTISIISAIPSDTQTATSKPTIEPTNTDTATQKPTIAPTNTDPPSPTLTKTPAPTATPTHDTTYIALSTHIAATFTPMHVNTADPSAAMIPETFYIRSDANLRTCPRTDCTRVAPIRAGDAITVVGKVDGQSVNGGSTLWYRVNYQEQEAYVYGSLVSASQPLVIAATRVNRPATNPPGQTSPVVVSTRVPVATSVPVAQPVIVPTAAGSGATAQCKDGSFSYSQHRQGTCSHHGGVAIWINRPAS